MTIRVLPLYLEYINNSCMFSSMPLTKSVENMVNQDLGDLSNVATDKCLHNHSVVS